MSQKLGLCRPVEWMEDSPCPQRPSLWHSPSSWHVPPPRTAWGGSISDSGFLEISSDHAQFPLQGQIQIPAQIHTHRWASLLAWVVTAGFSLPVSGTGVAIAAVNWRAPRNTRAKRTDSLDGRVSACTRPASETSPSIAAKSQLQQHRRPSNMCDHLVLHASQIE